MESIQKLMAILNKPFPEDASRFGNPKTALIISLFIAFFLIIFAPFGIESLGSDRYLICMGFGAVTFFTSIVYEYLISQILKLKGEREKWTLGKWIINNLGLMLAISLANFLFARLVIFGYIDWSLFPHMIYGTFMIGIIPIVALGTFASMVSERKHINIATEMNAKEATTASRQTLDELTIFDIPIDRFRYAEALQNYVKIGYVDADENFSTKTERGTLKQILKESAGSSIMKCHRSFIVSRDRIISTEGNAQGLLLTLSDCDVSVPVSRTYIPAFRS